MDDFSSELFNSFFDDHLLERPLLPDRPSLLHIDMDSSPGQLLFDRHVCAHLYIFRITDVGDRIRAFLAHAVEMTAEQQPVALLLLG